MLATEVALAYAGQVRFVAENYGASALATKYGITRYPALFVDDILVATPNDFGFFGNDSGARAGRYTPWRDPKSYARLKQDLTHMVDLVLAGHAEQVPRAQPEDEHAATVASLPALQLEDLDGHKIDAKALHGRVVVVEFWATWCPPCLSALHWLSDLAHRSGEELTVVAIATESPEAKVRELAKTFDPAIRCVLGNAEIGRAFGDLVVLPTLFVFDRAGKTESVFYGASDDLHAQVGAAVKNAMAR